MRQVLADTNVFISFLIERNEKQRVAARALFIGAENGEIAVILPQFVLFEIVYVLQTAYGVSGLDSAAVLKDALAMPGVLVTDECPWPLVLEYWPVPLPSIADAAIVAVAVAGRFDSVATFDQKLGRRLRSFGVESYW